MTYELIDIGNGKVNVKYSSGEFDGLIEAYYGQVRDGYKDINAPNYYGLEQGLFKSSLFSKYILDYNTKGLLFTQTINNGKRGEDVNENILLSGLQVMQINFTQSEKDFINQVFEQNNFTIRLT